MSKLIGLLLLYFSFHHLLIVRDNCDSGLVECAPKLTHFFHPSLLLRLYVGWEPVLKVSLYQYVCTHLGLLSVPDTNCHYAFPNSCSLKIHDSDQYGYFVSHFHSLSLAAIHKTDESIIRFFAKK